jgi:membrane-bound metal-dependent hydrolase YbcI (DUF457 family)
MTPVTHALLPVFLGRRWLPKRSDGAPSWAASGAVAFSGVLPDVLNPHLGLEARHEAFSHSLVAWMIFAGLLALTARHPRLAPHRRILALCGAAYAAHIACDLITGGVPLFAPIESLVWGDAWLPFRSWFVFDGALLVHAYLVYRWLPLRRRITRSRDFTPSRGEA